jgi:hypothetical protein
VSTRRNSFFKHRAAAIQKPLAFPVKISTPLMYLRAIQIQGYYEGYLDAFQEDKSILSRQIDASMSGFVEEYE